MQYAVLGVQAVQYDAKYSYRRHHGCFMIRIQYRAQNGGFGWHTEYKCRIQSKHACRVRYMIEILYIVQGSVYRNELRFSEHDKY